MIEFPGTICWNIWCLPNKYNLWTIDTITFFYILAYLAPILSSLELIHKHKTKKNVIIRDHSRSNVTNYGLRNEPKWECSRILILFSINFYGIPTSFRDFFRDFWPYKKCRIFFNFMPKDFFSDWCMSA